MLGERVHGDVRVRGAEAGDWVMRSAKLNLRGLQEALHS